jgi:hypothetical protein
MDIHSKHMDDYFHSLSIKYGCSKMTIKAIVSSQFETIKDMMKKVDSYNNYFPYGLLPFLCDFRVKKGKKNFLIEKSKKKIEDVYSQIGNSGDRTQGTIHTGV